MPEPVVEARFAAPRATVLAALTAALPRHGWHLTDVKGFGSVVTWQAFDRALELVTLRAELATDPDDPGLTTLRVLRVDPALDAALDVSRASTTPHGVPPAEPPRVAG